MNDFSHFIHEEIFLLNEDSKLHEQAEIGIIYNSTDSEEIKLLHAILHGINVNPNKVIEADTLTQDAAFWLDFTAKKDTWFTVLDKGRFKVIGSPSLGELQVSTDLKRELWNNLRVCFNI